MEKCEGREGQERKRKGGRGEGERRQGRKRKDRKRQRRRPTAALFARPARNGSRSRQQQMKEAQKAGGGPRQQAIELQEEAVRKLEQPNPIWRKSFANSAEENRADSRVLEPASAECTRCKRSLRGHAAPDRIPVPERTQQPGDRKPTALAAESRRSSSEVDKAALLLREEAAPWPFPEAVDQMVMTCKQRRVAVGAGKREQDHARHRRRHQSPRSKTMIAALKKPRRIRRARRRSRASRSRASRRIPPDRHAAELRMIRALQMRVNTRTARYSEWSKASRPKMANLSRRSGGLPNAKSDSPRQP